MKAHLRADWNQRTVARCGHRSGYYNRHLSTPHGQLRIRVPRCPRGAFDATVVFDRYQRRIRDVERILRHSYLLGASTSGLVQLAVHLFSGRLSHHTISRLMRWLDEQFLYGLRDSLRFYELPQRWWKRLRTNNALERLIWTLRVRLRPMGCFHNEKTFERAVFGQLLRWQNTKLRNNN